MPFSRPDPCLLPVACLLLTPPLSHERHGLAHTYSNYLMVRIRQQTCTCEHHVLKLVGLQLPLMVKPKKEKEKEKEIGGKDPFFILLCCR